MTSPESRPAHEQSFEWLAKASHEAELLPTDAEELTGLAGDINRHLETMRKAKRDSLDMLLASNISILASMSYGGFALGNVVGSANMLLNGIAFGMYMAETAAVINRRRQKRLTTTYYIDDYRLQYLYAQRESATFQKGRVIGFIHPPSSEGKTGPIGYSDESLSKVLHLLSQTTVDATIMPLDPKTEAADAVDVAQLIKDIKGYSCKIPYPEGTKAIYVTKEQLDKIAAGDVHRKLLQKVAAIYPSVASSLYTPMAQQAIGELLRQELIVDSRIQVSGFDENGEFDIVKVNRSPQVIGPMISMESHRTDANQIQPIASLAPLSPGCEKEIAQRLDTGSYDNLSVLALAWQSIGKRQALSDQPIQRRDHLKSPGLGPSRRETARLFRRMGAGAVGSLLSAAALSMAQGENETLPGLSVRAHGNASIEGYYAQSAVSDINGDTLEWFDVDGVVYDVPDKLVDAPAKDYIEATIMRSVDDGGVVNIPIKEHTRLAALQVTDDEGNVLSYNLLYSAESLPFIKVDTKGATRVRVVYKLIAAEGSGIAIPHRPITVYGEHTPDEDTTLRFDVSAEELAEQLSNDVPYNAGEPLKHMLEGANAANLAKKIYQPDGVANCDVSAKVVALNNSVAHDDNMAYVEGYAVHDTETSREEHVLVPHAWLATEDKPHIDATSSLPPGATLADVGLPDTSQQELADVYYGNVSEFDRAKHYPFPWEPLAALGGLALGGAAIHQRKRLGLGLVRAVDGLRKKVVAEPISPRLLSGLLAYESFASFDEPIDAATFSALRQEIARTSKTLTSASATNEALNSTIQGKSVLVKSLLDPKEQRSARRQAARMLRDRQWELLKSAKTQGS
ncbi:MAG TPA: hypothetical protein VFZ58_00245 [Candidatus Saccharimonadales bacterium]